MVAPKTEVKTQNQAPVSTMSVETMVEAKQEEPMVAPKKPSVSMVEPSFDEPPIFDHPPMFDDYDAPPASVKKTPVETPKVPNPAAEQPSAPKPVAQAPVGDAKATFGLFLRTLRKTGRNGVLFTICMDLDASYEDGVLVLSTESETMFNSMSKEEHYALIRQAFELIGVPQSGFDIRLKAKQADTFTKSLNTLKETFPNTKIEIK